MGKCIMQIAGIWGHRTSFRIHFSSISASCASASAHLPSASSLSASSAVGSAAATRATVRHSTARRDSSSSLSMICCCTCARNGTSSCLVCVGPKALHTQSTRWRASTCQDTRDGADDTRTKHGYSTLHLHPPGQYLHRTAWLSGSPSACAHSTCSNNQRGRYPNEQEHIVLWLVLFLVCFLSVYDALGLLAVERKP